MRDQCLYRLMQIRGATTRVAEGLGISTAAVSQWERVPRDRVMQVATILGVSPAEVRPDLYADEPAEAA
ncbi:MAG TPA: Cro/CI family transcriptional regulator [Steroidobacteraceae bacterium]|jgi:pyruvate kinase